VFFLKTHPSKRKQAQFVEYMLSGIEKMNRECGRNRMFELDQLKVQEQVEQIRKWEDKAYYDAREKEKNIKLFEFILSQMKVVAEEEVKKTLKADEKKTEEKKVIKGFFNKK